jgi:hypothetical protein
MAGVFHSYFEGKQLLQFPFVVMAVFSGLFGVALAFLDTPLQIQRWIGVRLDKSQKTPKNNIAVVVCLDDLESNKSETDSDSSDPYIWATRAEIAGKKLITGDLL